LRLLSSVPAGGGDVASSVAGGQDPVLCRGGVTGRLVSGYSLPPPTPPTSAGDWAWMSFDLLCNATCVNSCPICSDAHNISRYNRSGHDSIYLSIRYTQYWFRYDTDL